MKATFKNAWGYQDNNLGLPVGNLDASIPFYETAMGFRLLSRSDSPHRSAILGKDDVQIGLVENGGDPTQDGCAFEVDNIESAFAELQANGLDTELSELKTEERDGTTWRVFFVIAPDSLCYWLGERQKQ